MILVIMAVLVKLILIKKMAITDALLQFLFITEGKGFLAFFCYIQRSLTVDNLQHIFTQQSKGTGEIEVTENGQVVKVKDVSICK